MVILPELGGLRDEEFSEPLFIEPTTGVSYVPTDDDTDQLYLGVESIWNDQNYWVNVQPSSQSCANIAWDLTKRDLWEHLLPGEPWTMRGIEGDEDSAVLQEKHLDMPSSYVNEIDISDKGRVPLYPVDTSNTPVFSFRVSDFERRYPNGTKSIFYKKTKVEFYAPYVQTDGLVRRITTYDDYDYKSPIKVYEYYANRSDNLVEHIQNLSDGSIVDHYERGRPDRCKGMTRYKNFSASVEL